MKSHGRGTVAVLVVFRSPAMHHVACDPQSELHRNVADRHRLAYVFAIGERQNEITFACLQRRLRGDIVGLRSYLGYTASVDDLRPQSVRALSGLRRSGLKLHRDSRSTLANGRGPNGESEATSIRLFRRAPSANGRPSEERRPTFPCKPQPF